MPLLNKLQSYLEVKVWLKCQTEAIFSDIAIIVWPSKVQEFWMARVWDVSDKNFGYATASYKVLISILEYDSPLLEVFWVLQIRWTVGKIKSICESCEFYIFFEPEQRNWSKIFNVNVIS